VPDDALERLWLIARVVEAWLTALGALATTQRHLLNALANVLIDRERLTPAEFLSSFDRCRDQSWLDAHDPETPAVLLEPVWDRLGELDPAELARLSGDALMALLRRLRAEPLAPAAPDPRADSAHG
jgi:hypothetical protein